MPRCPARGVRACEVSAASHCWVGGGDGLTLGRAHGAHWLLKHEDECHEHQDRSKERRSPPRSRSRRSPGLERPGTLAGPRCLLGPRRRARRRSPACVRPLWRSSRPTARRARTTSSPGRHAPWIRSSTQDFHRGPAGCPRLGLGEPGAPTTADLVPRRAGPAASATPGASRSRPVAGDRRSGRPRVNRRTAQADLFLDAPAGRRAARHRTRHPRTAIPDGNADHQRGQPPTWSRHQSGNRPAGRTTRCGQRALVSRGVRGSRPMATGRPGGVRWPVLGSIPEPQVRAAPVGRPPAALRPPRGRLPRGRSGRHRAPHRPGPRRRSA